VALNHDWKVIYVNEEAEQLTGIPRHQLMRRRLWECSPYLHEAGIEENFQRSSLGNGTLSIAANTGEIKRAQRSQLSRTRRVGIGESGAGRVRILPNPGVRGRLNPRASAAAVEVYRAGGPAIRVPDLRRSTSVSRRSLVRIHSPRPNVPITYRQWSGKQPTQLPTQFQSCCRIRSLLHCGHGEEHSHASLTGTFFRHPLCRWP
jgi:hypothetical protein